MSRCPLFLFLWLFGVTVLVLGRTDCNPAYGTAYGAYGGHVGKSKTPMSVVGCFYRDAYRKILVHFLFAHKRQYRSAYGRYGYRRRNFYYFLKRLKLRCQREACKGGYRYYGLRASGECWAGHRLQKAYKKSKRYCIRANRRQCRRSSTLCAGTKRGMFVYRTASSCLKKPLTVVGCYPDSKSKRVLKHLIRTYRDNSSAVYAGSPIDWENLPAFMRKMISECHTVARKHGYKYLGIEYYGECWAGNVVHSLGTYKRSQCIDDKMKPCSSRHKLCSGKALSLFIYKL